MKTALAALLLLASAPLASAGDIRPMQGHTIDLGPVQGVAYYTVAADGGYALVATFASAENGTPVRFAATLSEGETVSVTVPGAPDEASPSVDFVRQGGVVRVAERSLASY